MESDWRSLNVRLKYLAFILSVGDTQRLSSSSVALGC